MRFVTMAAAGMACGSAAAGVWTSGLLYPDIPLMICVSAPGWLPLSFAARWGMFGPAVARIAGLWMP